MKKNNLVIDTPQRLEQQIESFKIDAVEQEKNLTSARIRVCRDPGRHTPVIFYQQELNRCFRHADDPLQRRIVLKAFEPNNVNASTDTALEFKFNDAVLAHQSRIDDYSPLTDIHSDQMNLFIDEESATFLADAGIDVDNVGGEFQQIESVAATPFMQQVAGDVHALKVQLADVEKNIGEIKAQMLSEIGIEGPVEQDRFEQLISQHDVSVGLVQRYLMYKERCDKLRAELNQASDAVFSETKTMIKLPARIHGL